jgi:hypothetical protein
MRWCVEGAARSRAQALEKCGTVAHLVHAEGAVIDLPYCSTCPCGAQQPREGWQQSTDKQVQFGSSLDCFLCSSERQRSETWHPIISSGRDIGRKRPAAATAAEPLCALGRQRIRSVVPRQKLDLSRAAAHFSRCGYASPHTPRVVGESHGGRLSPSARWGSVGLVAVDRASPGQHSTRGQTPCRGARRSYPRRAGMRLPCAQRDPLIPTIESVEREVSLTCTGCDERDRQLGQVTSYVTSSTRLEHEWRSASRHCV